jgi:hypothetical protein
VQEVIERYIACWNQTDPGLRRKLIDEVWAKDASYTDPLGEAVGQDAIDATIAAVQQQFPGSASPCSARWTATTGRRGSPGASPLTARSQWSSVSTSPWPPTMAGSPACSGSSTRFRGSRCLPHLARSVGQVRQLLAGVPEQFVAFGAVHNETSVVIAGIRGGQRRHRSRDVGHRDLVVDVPGRHPV